MGHGSRELSTGDTVEIPVLGPEHTTKLDAALGALDKLDQRFKEQRDEERISQLTKAWHRLGAEIDGHLRIIAKSVIASHQISLDVGSEGGGIKARPWLEETGGALERLYFGLVDGQMVASVGGRQLGTTSLKQVDYAWLEQMAVDWIVDSVANRQKALTAAPPAAAAAPARGPAPPPARRPG